MARNAASTDLLKKVEFKAGQRLFREGQPADALFVIEHGYVQVTKDVHSTSCQIETASDGDVLGEHALFEGQEYKATATAQEDTVCLKIQGSQFGEMVRRSPEIALRIMRKMASRLIHIQFRLANFTLRSPMARLMHQLLAEVERANTDRSVAVPFDLPEVLAMERGVVDDMIRRLINERLMSIDENGNFSINDLEGFQRCLTFLELRDRFTPMNLD